MSMVSAVAVREFVIADLDRPLRVAGLTPAAVSDDFDLIASGVIDSLGFLELISDVEAHFGVEIDFELLRADELGVIGSFSRFVAEQAKAAAA